MSEQPLIKIVQEGESALSQIDARTLARCSASEARELISYEIAQRESILPIGLFRGMGIDRLVIATHRGEDPELIKTLKFITDSDLQLMVVS